MIFSDGQPSTLQVHNVRWQERGRLGAMFRMGPPSRIFTTMERPLNRMIRYFVSGIVSRGDRSRFGLRLATDVIQVIAMADQSLRD